MALTEWKPGSIIRLGILYNPERCNLAKKRQQRKQWEGQHNLTRDTWLKIQLGLPLMTHRLIILQVQLLSLNSKANQRGDANHLNQKSRWCYLWGEPTSSGTYLTNSYEAQASVIHQFVQEGLKQIRRPPCIDGWFQITISQPRPRDPCGATN